MTRRNLTDDECAQLAADQEQERLDREISRQERQVENYPDLWSYNDGRGL